MSTTVQGNDTGYSEALCGDLPVLAKKNSSRGHCGKLWDLETRYMANTRNDPSGAYEAIMLYSILIVGHSIGTFKRLCGRCGGPKDASSISTEYPKIPFPIQTHWCFEVQTANV
jgi:ribosomal protein S27AE